METNLRITTNESWKGRVSSKVLYPELSFRLTGLLFSVHNELGRFAREKQYGDLFEKKLNEAGLQFKREQHIGDSGNIFDFVIEDKIALEFKAKPILLQEDFRQIQNYLYQSRLELGMLINFRNKYLKPERVLRIPSNCDKMNPVSGFHS